MTLYSDFIHQYTFIAAEYGQRYVQTTTYNYPWYHHTIYQIAYMNTLPTQIRSIQ